MAPGIGVGTALGILIGDFIFGPIVDSQTTGYILGMLWAAALGLVSGLSLSSVQGNETVNKKDKEN